MRKILLTNFFLAVFMMVVVVSCKHPVQQISTPEYGGFPDAVGKIMINKCATAGCHNAASYQNSAGLLLDTWEHLLQGGNSGASVIAYSPDFSPLLYFVNTNPDRGITATPTMPYDATGANGNTLTDEEYNTLKAWIADGAPDKDGNIPFATNADNRQKIYLTQQGCDQVAVIDAASNLVMRYISVGFDAANTESPHCLRTDAAGRYAYVSFLNGTGIQKIDLRTDQVTGNVTLGNGSWNILYVAPGDTALATTDWTSNGRVLYVSTGPMVNLPGLTGSGAGAFVFPHGITSDATFDTCFITAQYGNVVYKYAPKVPYYKRISINGNPPATTNSGDNTSPNPHEILMTPDYSKYFLTCEGTDEVRVIDAHTDAILAIIPVGNLPQEIAISRSKPYIFVTCMEDVNSATLPGRRGSVYVINYNTYEVVAVLNGDFYQPHGITVDDQNGTLLVASTNGNPDGPAPHHATACGGRAGWYSVYDINTLLPRSNKRYQVTVMPYSADTRFKNP